MADAADSKSAAGNSVRVRLPSPAPSSRGIASRTSGRLARTRAPGDTALFAFRFRLRPAARAHRADACARAQCEPTAARRRAEARRPALHRPALATRCQRPAGVQRHARDQRAHPRSQADGRRSRDAGRARHRSGLGDRAAAGEPSTTHRRHRRASRRCTRNRRGARRPFLQPEVRWRGRTAPLARAARRAAAAALHHPRTGCQRCRALPDRVCARARRGRSADRGPALRSANARGARGPRHRAGVRDAARRRGNLPAGPDRAVVRAPDAFGNLRDPASDRRRSRAGADTAGAGSSPSARPACGRWRPRPTRRDGCRPAPATRRCSSRRATLSASSTGCSPTSTCRNRR